jgi:hypothetical protein
MSHSRTVHCGANGIGVRAAPHATCQAGGSTFHHFATPAPRETGCAPTTAQVSPVTGYLARHGSAVAGLSNWRLPAPYPVLMTRYVVTAGARAGAGAEPVAGNPVIPSIR